MNYDNIALKLGEAGGVPLVESLTTNNPHAAIYGRNYWDKLVSYVVSDLISNYSPREISISGTGETVSTLLMSNPDFVDYMGAVDYSGEDEYIRQELERRIELFSSAGAQTLGAYNQDHEKLPALILFAEEINQNLLIANDLGKGLGLHIIGTHLTDENQLQDLAFTVDVESPRNALVNTGDGSVYISF